MQAICPSRFDGDLRASSLPRHTTSAACLNSSLPETSPLPGAVICLVVCSRASTCCGDSCSAVLSLWSPGPMAPPVVYDLPCKLGTAPCAGLIPGGRQPPGRGVTRVCTHWNAISSPAMLLLMRGLPGCGKSTLAVQLQKELGWPLLDKDSVRDSLSVLEDAVARDRLNACAYDVLYAVAEAQLATRLCVIVDTPLSRTALAERFGQLAAKASTGPAGHAAAHERKHELTAGHAPCSTVHKWVCWSAGAAQTFGAAGWNSVQHRTRAPCARTNRRVGRLCSN